MSPLQKERPLPCPYIILSAPTISKTRPVPPCRPGARPAPLSQTFATLFFPLFVSPLFSSRHFSPPLPATFLQYLLQSTAKYLLHAYIWYVPAGTCARLWAPSNIQQCQRAQPTPTANTKASNSIQPNHGRRRSPPLLYYYHLLFPHRGTIRR